MGLVARKIALGVGASRGMRRGIAHEGDRGATGIVTALWWGYVIIALIMIIAGCAASTQESTIPGTTTPMPEERHFLFTAEQEVAMLRRDRQQAGRLGEGQGDTGGDKYHSINSFGVKHYVYLRGIQRKIEKVFSVPPFAPDRGAIGVPIVDFTIRRDGTLAEAVLLRSSGYPTLDKALVEAVRRAAPYRPFPDHLTDPAISIRVYANVGSCACK